MEEGGSEEKGTYNRRAAGSPKIPTALTFMHSGLHLPSLPPINGDSHNSSEKVIFFLCRDTMKLIMVAAGHSSSISIVVVVAVNLFLYH